MEPGDLENGGDPYQPQAASPHQRNDHGHDGIAKAPQRAHIGLHQAAQCIGGAEDDQTVHTCGNDDRTVGIEAEKLGTQEDNQTAKQQTYHKDTDNRAVQDRADTVMASGSHVLTGKRHIGLIKGIHRCINKAFNVGCCRTSGHDNFAEGVDGGLDDHVGQGKQGALQACWQADAQNFLQLRRMNAQVL